MGFPERVAKLFRFSNGCTLAPLAGSCLALAWSYWPTLQSLVRRWTEDAQYSHGFLVPAFALFLLWTRGKAAERRSIQVSWWGVAVLAGGAILRLGSVFFYFEWLDAVSLLVCLAGIAVLLGGWAAWSWCWPAVAFLLFMVPLPFQVEVSLSRPLQGLATQASTYSLQTLGLPALAEGNIIIIDDIKIGVLEACNGLGMLFSFFALSTAVAILIRRPVVDRVIICLSAVPVALVMNVARITVTGVLHRTAGSAIANAVFHDLAGWLMMPLALGVLWLEVKLLTRIFISSEVTGPVPVVFNPGDRIDVTC
jgi:exosortase